MADSPDYYAVLGIRPDADRKAVHAAWKALLRRYHPDANHGVDVSARAKQINEAYAVLGRTDARAAYDRSRLPPPPRPTPPHRPVYGGASGKRPSRPGPSMNPGSNVPPPPLNGSQWLTGLFLLLLTAAPLGMIVVLYYEESVARQAGQRASAVHRGSEPMTKFDPVASGAKVGRATP